MSSAVLEPMVLAGHGLSKPFTTFEGKIQFEMAGFMVDLLPDVQQRSVIGYDSPRDMALNEVVLGHVPVDVQSVDLPLTQSGESDPLDSSGFRIHLSDSSFLDVGCGSSLVNKATITVGTDKKVVGSFRGLREVIQDSDGKKNFRFHLTRTSKVLTAAELDHGLTWTALPGPMGDISFFNLVNKDGPIFSVNETVIEGYPLNKIWVTRIQKYRDNCSGQDYFLPLRVFDQNGPSFNIQMTPNSCYERLQRERAGHHVTYLGEEQEGWCRAWIAEKGW